MAPGDPSRVTNGENTTPTFRGAGLPGPTNYRDISFCFFDPFAFVCNAVGFQNWLDEPRWLCSHRLRCQWRQVAPHIRATTKQTHPRGPLPDGRQTFPNFILYTPFGELRGDWIGGQVDYHPLWGG